VTLPFRRRHHDDESSHDRARALTSAGMLERLGSDDAGWLAGHLESCAECRQEREAFLADRDLLRGLREHTPEPPRDLWARTSAALEREARTNRGRPTGAPARSRGLPFGALAGALIVLVVIGASIIPPIRPPSATAGTTFAALISSEPQATTFQVTAGPVSYLRTAANGSWEFVRADIDGVCPRSRPSCRRLTEDGPGRPVNLGGTPVGMTISPNEDQLVVEARGAGTAPDRILVVPVPSASPAVTPAPTTPVATEPATTQAPSAEPATPEPASPEPSATADVIIEIASGVMVVGEAAYSSDGRWLAFSARPSNGTAGPDLYLWSVGQPTAVAVTTDHRTYFSAWLGGQLLASRVDLVGSPPASDAPTAAPDADASDAPATIEAHATSFLLDPATLTRTDLTQPDLWMPVVDPTGRFVAYWSGTLMPTADGLDWQPGTGQLVLSAWSAGPDAQPSADPDTTADPAGTPLPAFGPTGTPVTIVGGPTAAFKAKFDPTGTRLAVWVGEQLDADVGRLHLVVLDPTTGAIAAGPEPLTGVPALRRFSIDVGRVAWVTPSGQDGQESTVQVLGWTSTEFGEIRTIPAKALYIVR
jgi:hypothetical protein